MTDSNMTDDLRNMLTELLESEFDEPTSQDLARQSDLTIEQVDSRMQALYELGKVECSHDVKMQCNLWSLKATKASCVDCAEFGNECGECDSYGETRCVDCCSSSSHCCTKEHVGNERLVKVDWDKVDPTGRLRAAVDEAMDTLLFEVAAAEGFGEDHKLSWAITQMTSA